VFCSQCGSQNQDAARFCGKCGAPLAAAASGGPTRSHPAGHRIHMPKNPLNIAQMMMVFCLLLTVVIPVAGFYQWFVRGLGDTYGMMSAGQVSQFFDNSNSNSGSDVGREFLEVFTLRIAIESPLLILSVYSGVMLWKKKPGALALAQRFLLALAVFLVCSHLVFPHFFGLSESYDTVLAVEFWLSVMLLAGCCCFLLVSTRVKDFYKAPLAPAAVSKLE
jgi:zinc-ribbon domain/Protein of unknown function (DUF2569)